MEQVCTPDVRVAMALARSRQTSEVGEGGAVHVGPVMAGEPAAPAVPTEVPAEPLGAPAEPLGAPALPLGAPALPLGTPAVSLGAGVVVEPPVFAPTSPSMVPEVDDVWPPQATTKDATTVVTRQAISGRIETS